MSGIDPVTGTEVTLFNPRMQNWDEHFRWADDQQTVAGLTPSGRATVVVLNMNSEPRREARRLWITMGLLP